VGRGRGEWEGMERKMEKIGFRKIGIGYEVAYFGVHVEVREKEKKEMVPIMLGRVSSITC